MKHTPGCTCCENVICEENCRFPCLNALDTTECLFCGITIQIPTPDTVDVLDPLIPQDPECPTSAPCWICYTLFDRFYNFWEFTGTCEAWVYQSLLGHSSGGDIYLDFFSRGWACWQPYTATCPYDLDSQDLTCFGAKIVITESTGIGEYGWEADPEPIRMSGPEWDGECGKITLRIRYMVAEFEARYGAAPIEPEICNAPKYTIYTHNFELSYCDCSDLLNAFTYISTSTEDSCEGGVPDPCNIDQAEIKLVRKIETVGAYEHCSTCFCMNCDGYSSKKMLVSISGPVINGTWLVYPFSGRTAIDPRSERCEYTNGIAGQIIESTCISNISIYGQIACLECDKFRAFINIVTDYGQGPVVLYEGNTAPFDCGDTATFDMTFYNGQCSLDSHTIQLSFVPD